MLEKFDDDLPIGDIMQAMRNVWISNALQLLFGKEIYYSKANFAYSMLYPYTDNYLDNTNIDKNDKILFNNWLEKGSWENILNLRIIMKVKYLK